MRRQSQFLFPNGAHFGTDNLVLHAKARRHVVEEFSGPLSIKTVLKGEVSWIVDHRCLTLDNRGSTASRQ
jgi:AraC family transcriptional regulator